MTPERGRGHSGEVLGQRYRLTERIAVGGMGEVWKGLDDVLGREVAVKVLKPEYAGDHAFLERFRHEARHTASLGHPNIAGIYDYGEGDDSAYLVMELVPGEPLNDLLAREGALPVDRAMDLLAQAAAGLSAAHAAGVVHRDVKPGNLLVTPDGVVKLTDFGIARAADQVPLTATGQVMGTAQYIAPEQAMGRPATAASDVYSLGVIGFEALTGRRPFGGETPVAMAMAHVRDEPPALPEHLPAGARALIGSALAKDPADRPADAGVFAAAARAVADGRDEEATALLPVAGAAAAAGAAGAGATRPMTSVGAMTAAAPPAAVGTTAAAQGAAAGASGASRGRPRRRMTGPLLALLALLLFVGGGAVLASGAFDDPGADGAAPAATTPAGDPSTPQPAATTEPAAEEPAAEETTAAPPPEQETTDPGIVVDAAAYVGRDKDEVVKELEALGLRVEQSADRQSDAEKNRVVAVDPTGSLSEGDVVTVVYSDPAEGEDKGEGDTGDEDKGNQDKGDEDKGKDEGAGRPGDDGEDAGSAHPRDPGAGDPGAADPGAGGPGGGGGSSTGGGSSGGGGAEAPGTGTNDPGDDTKDTP